MYSIYIQQPKQQMNVNVVMIHSPARKMQFYKPHKQNKPIPACECDRQTQ